MSEERTKEWYWAERQAHQINRGPGLKSQCHCLVCQPDESQVCYGEIQVLHHIKAGICPDGAFRAKSQCGAEISLQIDPDTGDLCLLVVESLGSKWESWRLKK